MTTKRIDPDDLHLYIGRRMMVTCDFGWDMNDEMYQGILRGVDDGYFYIQMYGEGYDDFRDLGGAAIHCITSVELIYN